MAGSSPLKQTFLQLPEIHLMGIQARTSNQAEGNSSTAKIGPTAQRYFQERLAEKIPYRSKPGITYAVYMDYDSDFNGAYTYFIGEEAPAGGQLPAGLERYVIPAQAYTKFTTDPGPMPHVVISAWQAIWGMSEADLGGARLYLADFELYDARAQDSQNAVVDLYIGIKIPCTPR